jgi:predicted RNA binding protein YcfA (HicA-like mRNA interferase family)
MPKLPQLPGAEVVRRLKRLGMEHDHNRGGHAVMRNPTTGNLSDVPQHGSTAVKKGTLGAILKQLGVSLEDFCNS